MKRLTIIGVLTALCCGFPIAVRASLYRYDFIPTRVAGTMYPLSAYTGSYIDLTAPSGKGVNYSVAIGDWHLVTGQGVLDNSNSVHDDYADGPPTLSWNPSTITSVSAILAYSGGTGSNALLEMWITDTEANAMYYVGNSMWQTETAYGTWQPQPVPEPSSSALIPGIALLFVRRRTH